jgi:ABC-type multidrug transport system fused ATPase/permease subunit
MLLETLSVGLVVPALALLTQRDPAGKYPFFKFVLDALGNPNQETLVIGGMLALVAVYVVKTVYLGFVAWRQSCFAFDLQAGLSQRLFTVYLRQPYTFHLQRNSAHLIRNMITEVNGFTSSAVTPGLILLAESLVLIGLGSLLLAVEPIGAVVAATVLGVAAWCFHRFTRARLTYWGDARQHHDGLRLQHLQQGLGGVKDVKLLGRETDFLEQYRVHNVQTARAGQFHVTLQQLPRLWLELLAVSGLAILVISMMARGLALEAIVPALGLFVVTAFRLMPSVARVLNAMQGLRYGLPIIDILDAELRLPATPLTHPSCPSKPFTTMLDLRNVTFTYPVAHVAALSGVTFAIRRSETVGFVGSSGAGKSTLVDVVLGLLTPDTGVVCMDGEDIQRNLRNWQDQIGYVPQSIYLTDDSLRRNVAFGLPSVEIDEASVWRAIRAARLEDFVNGLPQGLETMVGERGVRLSGGQRQRIGIARALYHDPAVLVLDEATSSLDTDTERGVMQAVRALQGEKTILIVAHRLSTVEYCDRIYRLDLGRVIAEGTPQAILESRASA